MSENYNVNRVSLSDRRQIEKIKELLKGEGIRLDPNLDYLCAAEDDDYELAGCAGAFKNSLRCFAVRSDLRGQGIMNLLLSHLLQMQAQRGNMHLFVYTKAQTAGFFKDCGFYEIERIEGKLSFLENKRKGLESWIRDTAAKLPAGEKTALVMNCNPFTLGHRHLIEKAAENSERTVVFVLSEDAGPIPFAVRLRLVQEGVKDMPGVTVIPSGPYMISSATFPSYFQKDEDDVVLGHALLDALIFEKIAKGLDISARFVGDEPFSRTTALYNGVLKENLPPRGVKLFEIPRFGIPEPVSASRVRELLKEEDFGALSSLVPPTTLDFFRSEEARPVMKAIKACEDLRHH